ncbi:TetR family transcriptional regulator [Gillisia sp. Hel_I_86]|uniref:TetR/AcrR family transcriptional regulator n=1 Tax=Gillisia sp. Hel_I_86 TaxID=1249981 RepID=UPI00119A93FB|nr:TetR/AcrR family transcriptional regulator [Gillisia sp. Hel_I_86]TVZ25946.1 TetR family transcriptional regulator [Gillisia sp. Hel_I_86]
MREKILHKAVELFLNFGFKSVTMDDIASEMGISKKTIYAHFSTKTKLVEAASLHIFDIISTGINCISAKKLNVIEETFEIKDFAMQHLNNERSSPQYQLNKYYPKTAALLKKKQYEIMQSCVVDNLNRGIETGIYRKDIPVSFISKIYFIGITGIKDNDIFPPEEISTPELMQNYLEYHLRAIVTDKGIKTLNQFIKKIPENK